MSARTSADASADSYPGLPGASRADVDALLLALDEYEPVVRRAVDSRARRVRSTWTRATWIRSTWTRVTWTDERARASRVSTQIPDELTNHYLKRAGVPDPDARVTRLISLVTERFVQQIADDAYRCAVQRNQAQAKDKRERGYDTRDKRIVLENEDLAAALRDYGVHLHKPPYYVGAVNAKEAEEEAEAEAAAEAAAEKEDQKEAPSKKRRARR